MRSITPWYRKTPWKLVEEWRKQVREKNAEANRAVQTRQVNRRELFEAELRTVNEQYGGEPRKARRGIARTLANRRWKARKKAA